MSVEARFALEDRSLSEARAWLRDRVDDGDHCPCCGQFSKVYKRRINAPMARSLIVMHRHDSTATHGWINVPDVVGARSREEGKLAYWGLIEEETARREDGGRAGWWRITEKGRLYVMDALAVPRYARVYDGRCLGFAGPLEGIRVALGERFDYGELMAA